MSGLTQRSLLPQVWRTLPDKFLPSGCEASRGRAQQRRGSRREEEEVEGKKEEEVETAPLSLPRTLLKDS